MQRVAALLAALPAARASPPWGPPSAGRLSSPRGGVHLPPSGAGLPAAPPPATGRKEEGGDGAGAWAGGEYDPEYEPE